VRAEKKISIQSFFGLGGCRSSNDKRSQLKVEKEIFSAD
jgi:hypothetical protein